MLGFSDLLELGLLVLEQHIIFTDALSHFSFQRLIIVF
jgi:hypothetical protein